MFYPINQILQNMGSHSLGKEFDLNFVDEKIIIEKKDPTNSN